MSIPEFREELTTILGVKGGSTRVATRSLGALRAVLLSRVKPLRVGGLVLAPLIKISIAAAQLLGLNLRCT